VNLGNVSTGSERANGSGQRLLGSLHLTQAA